MTETTASDANYSNRAQQLMDQSIFVDGMTRTDVIFCLKYIQFFDGEKAAKEAGIVAEQAEEYSEKMLKSEQIQAYLKVVMQDCINSAKVTADRTIAEIAHIAYSDIGNFFDEEGALLSLKKVPESTRKAVKSIEVVTKYLDKEKTDVEYIHKIQFWDKPKALEQLMKHLGLYAQDDDKLSANTEVLADFFSALSGKTRGRPNLSKEEIEDAEEIIDD